MQTKSKLAEMLNDVVNSENQNDFSVVTYRTSAKIGTMIELMSVVLKQPVSTLFTSSISENLVNYMQQDKRDLALLEEYFESRHSRSGWINVLMDKSLIEEEYGDLDF